jgi:hypothetical protein
VFISTTSIYLISKYLIVLSFAQEVKNSMDWGGDSAEAGLAGIVEPAQAEIVHPPDLRSGTHGDVDADGIEVAEAVVQGNGGQCATSQGRAGRNRDTLGGDCGGVAGAPIVPVTSEMEDAVRTAGVTAEGCSIHVEAEAASQAMIAVANVARVAVLRSVGSSHGVGAINVEVGDELAKQRLRGRQVWSSWRRNDDETIREVKLVIWVEDRLWLNVIGVGVGDAQWGNIVKLAEVSLHALLQLLSNDLR